MRKKTSSDREHTSSAQSPAAPTVSAAWSWHHDLWRLALVVLVTFGAFANSLRNGFVYDDVLMIAQNPRLTNPWDLRRFFGTSYWDEPTNTLRLYRPLTVWSFAIDRAIFGPGPFGVHLMNVLANAIVAGLVYALIQRLFGHPLLALLTALLFGLHPVHTEVVANGSGRAELYASLAVFAAMHLHITWLRRSLARQQEKTAGKKGRTAAPAGLPHLLGAVTLFMAALFFKESAVVVPALLFIADWLLTSQGRFRHLLPRIPGYLLYLIPLAVYAGFRISVVGTRPPAMQEVMLGITTAQRLMHGSETMLRYLGQLSFPWHLCAEYSDYRNPVRPRITDPLVLASLVAWAVTTALSATLYRRRQHLVLFGILWFFVALLPVSHLIVPIGTIRADRLLFFPSLGFVLILAYLLIKLAEKHRAVGAAAAIAILCFYAWRSYTRNFDWYSNDTLWEVTLRQNPGSAVGWLAWGHGRQLAGQYEEAAKAYQRAWQLRDGLGFFYLDAHLSHADMLKQLKDDRGAEEQYQLVLKHEPRNRAALMNLGELLSRDPTRGPEAREFLKRAIEEDPSDFRGYANMAQACKRTADYPAALRYIDEAIRLEPQEANLWRIKADILHRAGRSNEALQARQHAEELDRRP
jgi:tetratricopeptide (TPR) repeat protein